MVRDTRPAQTERNAAILRVIESVARRRMNGDDVPNETVLAENPNLLPELRDQLEALRTAEIARQTAEELGEPDDGGDGRALPRLPFAETLGAYRMEEVIGQGGMSVVHRAVHLATNRTVAVKVMNAGPFAGPQEEARFEREAQILAGMRHPNIVNIHDTGAVNGRYFLVMDFVDGEPLDTFVKSHELDIHSTLELFAKICETVNAAHLQSVIHRDLKPSNILIDQSGAPHLLDFGLATVTAGVTSTKSPQATLTLTGQFVGSLPWASPEQAEGIPAAIDLRTDVYSLGVIGYQLLTERFPYSVVGNLRDIVDRILTHDPPSLRGINKRIDDETETIILKCLSKAPQRRYQSAGELAQDVRRYLAGEPIEAKRDSKWYVFRKTVHRHRIAAGVVLAFFVLAIGFGASMSVLYQREQAEATRARRTLAFLQDTLFQASSKQLGGDATLAEVLDHAALALDTEFADQPQVEAALRYTVGSAYETLWQKRKSIAHLRRSLELYLEELGEDHPDTLRCMVLLGMVLAELLEPESIELERRALTIRRRLYPEPHALIAESMTELAFSLWVCGRPPRFEEAEQLYEAALAMYHKTLGTQHADIARLLHAQAMMRDFQGQIDEAAKLFAESLEMSRSLLGPNHQFVLECMRDYSSLLARLDRFDEAESLMQQVIDKTPRLFGRAWLPVSIAGLAAVQNKKGDPHGAQRTLGRALAVECERLAEVHPSQAARLHKLASYHRGVVNSSEDPIDYHETIEVLCALTDNPGGSAQVLFTLAGVVRGLHGPDEAVPILRGTLRLLDGPHSLPKAFPALVATSLGKRLLTLGNYVDAEQYLLEGYRIFAEAVGPSHPWTRQTADALIKLYQQTDRPREAEKYRPPAKDASS